LFIPLHNVQPTVVAGAPQNRLSFVFLLLLAVASLVFGAGQGANELLVLVLVLVLAEHLFHHDQLRKPQIAGEQITDSEIGENEQEQEESRPA
jgi:hypothetical protein